MRIGIVLKTFKTQRGGAEVSDESSIRIAASETPSRVLLIDVAEKFAAPAGG